METFKHTQNRENRKVNPLYLLTYSLGFNNYQYVSNLVSSMFLTILTSYFFYLCWIILKQIPDVILLHCKIFSIYL